MTEGGGGTAGEPVYDRIGRGYTAQRVADHRWQAAIDAALGDAATVVNVGAGAGSYEPADRSTIAIEPSSRMIAQRPAGSAPVVRGVAEALPVADATVDAALAVLTTHHWTDAAAGLAELRRVAARQVVVTWAPEVTARFWLVADYLPEIAVHEATLATLAAVVAGLPGAEVSTLPVPADITDGVLGAHWARPEAYLDPAVRTSISSLSLLPGPVVERAMARLAADLDSGAWHDRYGHLLGRAETDLGYRLVVAGSRRRVTAG
ncbi:MAG: methyltransferase domain-containing protein [Acidimicrobiales bacterium]|nr:methyltransferase domain-containing protein [Acidimicrobiales bacterium]